MEKAEILQEIKRTAAANGGVPLGERRFESETGIGRSDWWGKYWARWADAVREAGFPANRPTAAHDSMKLLETYARFARELHHLPTDGELRLKAHNTPGFPSTSTFARLGTKAEIVAQLMGYCRGHEGYDDVVRLCEEYIPRKRSGPRKPPVPEEETGFVYLIKSGRFYKIGRSNAAGRRAYELRIQLPEGVKEIHVIQTDDPSGIEAYWHERFKVKRKKGEWFELDAADVKAFKRRKFM